MVCTLRSKDLGGSYLKRRGIAVRYLGLGKYSPSNVRAITEMIIQEKAELIHLHGYSAANFGRMASKKTGVANVVHEHAVLKTLPHQFVADLLLRSATDAAVAVSENVKRFMIRSRSIPERKIRVIWNGIDLAKFKRLAEEAIAGKKKELNIPIGAPVIGTVTRLREEKGVEHLIRAIPVINRAVPEAFFLIVGDGPLRSQLADLTQTLRAGRQTLFLGFRDDVADLLSLFDVNVIPSLTEGFPLSLIEGMCIGTPIVATAVGGINEIGVEGENVLFVRPKSADEIAHKVIHLLKDSAMREKFRQSGRRLSQKFGIENNATKLRLLYDELTTHC
jgi:glycosyltransferase involved in cell wall biosynthesis